MKIKIEIKHYLKGDVLFEYEKENNTLKDTLIEGVKRNANLRGADLSNADLRGADLYGADLSNANLYGADLSNADLYGADLSNANLYDADLRNANLINANLRGANLYGADLSNADLYDADLCGADLRGADLYGADLRGADLYDADLCGANIPFIPFSCPTDGAFIGWKKITKYKELYKGDYLVKLGIPEDARRCSATTFKCRCDKARVLEITRIEDGKNVDIITNTSYGEFVYKVGEMVISDSFDENRWNECSNGIHFFINKQQAIDY